MKSKNICATLLAVPAWALHLHLADLTAPPDELRRIPVVALTDLQLARRAVDGRKSAAMRSSTYMPGASRVAYYAVLRSALGGEQPLPAFSWSLLTWPRGKFRALL